MKKENLYEPKHLRNLAIMIDKMIVKKKEPKQGLFKSIKKVFK